MALGAIAAFWLVSLMFVVTPGADWAYAITAGLRHRTVTPAVGGMLAGHLAVAAVVAAGVAALVSRSPVAMPALTAGGAVYLLWLGVGMLRGPAGALAAAGAPVSGASFLRSRYSPTWSWLTQRS